MRAYELSHQAKIDITNILEYSYDRFGEAQMLKYKLQLDDCLERVVLNSTKFISIKGKKLQYLHCEKHTVFGYRMTSGQFRIIAVLHERMDFNSRLRKRLLK